MRTAWVAVAVVAALAIWMARLQVVHVRAGEFVVLDRLTGAIRYCDATACVPVPDTPYPPRSAYEDLVPKK